MKNSMQDEITGNQTTFNNKANQHGKTGTKIYETLKRKLSLGANIVQGHGLNKVFRQLFKAKEEEKLLRVSQCYLSTTAGPMAGLLCVSTEIVAFCSERSLTFTSPSGELIRTLYKVIIPLGKIKRATQCENAIKPEQKYLKIVTKDNFDFWLMGFVNYSKVFNCVQKAISLRSKS